MAQQREATTDRLVGIITSIKMERKSGRLQVGRGEGLTSEEGILIFTRGQVTQASIGRRSGADAVNWLSTWEQARYIFTSTSPDSAEETPLVFSVLPSSSPGGDAAHPGLRAGQVQTDKLETEPLPASRHEVPRVCVVFNEASTRLEHAGLTRAHRRLYLLIDGQRSASDLAPLLGKRTEEVRSMLHDLEWLGVVQITNLLSEC